MNHGHPEVGNSREPQTPEKWFSYTGPKRQNPIGSEGRKIPAEAPRAHSGALSIRPFERSDLSLMTMETLLPTLHGMVAGMATAKVTITLPDRQLEEIRKRVAARDSPSVSGFIQEAVQRSLENAAEFREIVAEALKKTGGPLKGKERAWARKMLSARRRGTRPRTAA